MPVIQPPEPVVRRFRTRLAAVVAAAVVLAVPAVGLVAVAVRPTPTSVPSNVPVSAPPVAARSSPPSTPATSPVRVATPRTVVVVPTATGPMAVAVGFGHVWVASVGDATLRRVDPDGSPSASIALVAAPISRTGREPAVGPAGPAIGPASPVIGLGAGIVWVAGVDDRPELVGVDATRLEITRRMPLPAAATGIVGAFGVAWVALADGRVIRVDAHGIARPVLGRSAAPVHLAAGDAYLWASRARTTIAFRPDGSIARRLDAGGGPIGFRDGTAWVLGTAGPARDLAAIDESRLRTAYRSDVGTSGFADIAWSLPSITPLGYEDPTTAVAPRAADAVLVDGVAWVARPADGELWRIGPPAG